MKMELNCNSIIFPDMENAIIGIDYTDQHVIYDFDLMVKILMDRDKMTEDETIEFIEYNHMGSLPYFNKDFAPIILMKEIKNNTE